MLDQSPSEGTSYSKTIIKGTLLFVALPPRQFTQVVTSLTTEASCCPETLHIISRKHKNHSPWQWYHKAAANELHTIPPHSHIWRTCTLLSEIEACLHSRPYALYPTTHPIIQICPLDTFHWLTTHLLPTIDKTSVNFNSFSGGKLTNNRYSSYGSANQQITSKPLFIKATCWDTGLSTTRPLCALSSDPLNTSFNS